MKTFVSSLATCFIVFASPAQVVNDQYYLPTTITGVVQARSSDFNGQTFTVGRSGQLMRVDLLMSRTPDVAEDLFVYLNRVEFFPGTTIATGSMTPLVSRPLSAAVIPLRSYPIDQMPMVSVDFSATPVPVQQGEVIAILTSSSIPPNSPKHLDLYGGPPDYPGGYRLQTESLTSLVGGADSSIDFGFSTHIMIPEPSSTVLSAVAAIFVLCCQRPRRCLAKFPS